MRLAADAVIALERGGYHGDVSAIEALLAEVGASFLATADRLADEAPEGDEPWRATVTDLDIVDGAGTRVEPILRDLVDYVEAHRDDPAMSRYILAVIWGLGWLRYLASVRITADAPLAEVMKR
jgi:hypothetical protein